MPVDAVDGRGLEHMKGARMEQPLLSRRRFLCLAAASGATLIAACQPRVGEETQKSATVATKEATKEVTKEATRVASTTKITFWTRSANDELVFTKMLPLCRQAFPELEVVFETPPGKIYEKLRIALAGGTAPDSLVMRPPDALAAIGEGTYVSLSPFLQGNSQLQDSLDKHFVKASVDTYTYRDELYCMPLTCESIVFWYNKDAIENAGLTPPAEIEDDPKLWNWETLRQYALSLNKGTGLQRERYGVACAGNNDKDGGGFKQGYGSFLLSNGGQFLNEEGTKCIINSPESKETLQFMLDLIYKHDVHPTVDSIQRATLRTMFQTGQVGMDLEGEFFSRYLWGTNAPKTGIPFKYDLAKIPFSPKGKRVGFFNALGAPILRQSKHPEETWKWLTVIGSLEGQQLITDFWGSRAPDKRTYASWLEAGAGGGEKGLNYKAIPDSDSFGVPQPCSPYVLGDQFREPLNRIVFDLILQGKVDPEEGLAKAEREVTAVIEQAIKEKGLEVK